MGVRTRSASGSVTSGAPSTASMRHTRPSRRKACGVSPASVSGGGDTNNDSMDDFVIGALQDSTAGTYSGSAYVVLGFTRGQNTLPSGSTQLTGDGPYDRFGQAVDVVEDVDEVAGLAGETAGFFDDAGPAGD